MNAQPDGKDSPDLQLEEVGRRVKAVRAYAALSIPELAERLGVGAQTIKRIEAGRRAAKNFELWAIADICEVPRWIFDGNGRDPDDGAGGLAAKVRALEARLVRLEQQRHGALSHSPGANGRGRTSQS
jgi:transcriptional regulator with XRE-family HTH domain